MSKLFRRALSKAARAIADSPLRPLGRAVANLPLAFGPRTRIVKLMGAGEGLRMRIDYRYQKSYAFGVYEPRMTSLLLSRLTPRSCFWDVGGHVGYYSLLASRRVGPEGAVIAFEPLPENHATLIDNLAMNGISNVEVHGVALGDTSGTASLSPLGTTVLPAGATILPPSSIEGLRSPDLRQPIKVAMESGDALVRKGIRPPTLIKVDVEGAEALVLDGLRDTLSRHRPEILIELHDMKCPSEARRARGILREHGYRIASEDIEVTHPTSPTQCLALPEAP